VGRERAGGRFPFRLAAGEAMANLRASPVRTAVAFVVGVAMGALIVAAACFEVGRIVAYDEELRLAGANLFVVQRADGQGVDAARCDSLRSRRGVVTAGGVASAERVVSSVDTGVSFDLLRASPGYAAVTWPELQQGVDSGAVFAGSRVTEALGIADRGGLAYAGHGTPGYTEVSVAVGEARWPEAINHVVVPVAPVGRLSQCYVEADPGARGDVESLLVGWFDEPARLLVNAAMPEAPLGMSPNGQLASRFTRWAPLAAAVFILVVQSVLWIARRTDVGLYGLLGLRGARLAAMVATDWVFTVLVPVCAGMCLAAAWLASRLDGLVLAVTAWDCLRTVALLAVIPLVVVALLKMVKPFDAIRGR
jgi:hypothetical protein